MLDRRTALVVLALTSALAAGPAGAAEDAAAPLREQLLPYAADTWRSLSSMVQPSGLPADGLHRASDGTWKAALQTSPTNIASYLWSVLAAEELRLIDPDEAGLRIGQTLERIPIERIA